MSCWGPAAWSAARRAAVQVQYFALLREQAGRSGEKRELPARAMRASSTRSCRRYTG